MNNAKSSCPVSVVIGVHNAASVISSCLAALQAQIQGTNVEIIIVDSSTDKTDQIICEQFPDLQLLHFDQPLTLAELRGKGIAIAKGNIIAILDPYSVVAQNWLSELMRVHSEIPNLIIGGTVDLFNAEHQNLLTWAVYINEYGMFMPPLEAGAMEILAGSNISYKRKALFTGDNPKHSEFWKTFVNWNIEQDDSSLWQSPSMLVYLNKPIPFWDFFWTRFDHGRCFAGMRSLNLSPIERLVRALTSPLLPFVLLWRWGTRYWRKRRYRQQFLLTLPLQILLFGNWAWGECVGYCFGTGKSCDRLFY
ncbi:glycosyltransferase family 2 protein (plasmid) [Pseudanabaena biceps]|nr:glycosyltransferase family 2 protein [Pseudanabaena biceps]